jgi:glycosyltransferase involved in cell wall biosynthesis
MAEPAVEVLLSTYNGGRYLRQLLDSILGQKGVRLRLTVRDDGSSDDTLDILRTYANAGVLDFDTGSNIGVANSFLELLRNASEEFQFTAFADQDDVWLSDKLLRAVTALSGEAGPAMYCSSLEVVDSSLKRLRTTRPAPRGASFQNAVVQNIATGCTIVLNHAATALLRERLPRSVFMHDWWIYQAISGVGRVIVDEEPRVLYRQHDANAIGAKTGEWQKRRAELSRFVERGGRFWRPTQLLELEHRFSDLWGPDQRRLVRTFIDAPDRFSARVDLVMSRRFYFQSRLQTMAFKLLTAIGRV